MLIIPNTHLNYLLDINGINRNLFLDIKSIYYKNTHKNNQCKLTKI